MNHEGTPAGTGGAVVPDPGASAVPSGHCRCGRMTRWEYWVDDWRAGQTPSHRGDLLNAGAEGWELVSVEQLTWHVLLTFKRPVVEA